MMDDFLKRLHSIAFRVRKDECLDLPAITEEVRTVDLEPKAMQLYGEIKEESYAELKNSEVTIMNILTRILCLSQITGGHLTDDEHTDHAVSTAKLDAEVKENNTVIEDLDRRLSEAMAEQEVDRFSRNGSLFYLSSRLFASPRAGEKEPMIAALIGVRKG